MSNCYLEQKVYYHVLYILLAATAGPPLPLMKTCCKVPGSLPRQGHTSS